SPHSQRGRLLRRWAAVTDPRFRAVMLEVYARRFYRIRELENLQVVEHSGHQLCVADYDFENKHIRLAVAYAALEEVPTVSRAVAAHLEAQPPNARPPLTVAPGVP